MLWESIEPYLIHRKRKHEYLVTISNNKINANIDVILNDMLYPIRTIIL